MKSKGWAFLISEALTDCMEIKFVVGEQILEKLCDVIFCSYSFCTYFSSPQQFSGNLAQAELIGREALRLLPHDPTIMFSLANVLGKLEKYKVGTTLTKH